MGDVYKGKLVIANNVNTSYRALAGPVKITLWHKWSNATEGLLTDYELDASAISPICTFNTESGFDDIWQFKVEILRGPDVGKIYEGNVTANFHEGDYDSVVLVNLHPGVLNEILQADFLFMDDRIRTGGLGVTKK